MNKRKKSSKAAIVTWCYDNGKTNYGQILQCYAMQTIMQRLGYNTKVIRYRKREHDEAVSWERKPQAVINLYELAYRLIRVEKKLDVRILRFVTFIGRNIFLSRQCYTKEQVEKECGDCEVLVCGSDQIWNPAWFQDVYALNFGKDSQKRIAYAPSGVMIENERNKKVYRQLGKYIDRFDLVTVREKKSIAILEKYTKKKIRDVWDPTLLLTQEDWNRVSAGSVTGKPYIFCYSLGRLRAHKVLLKYIMKKYEADRVLYIVSGYYENESDLERGGYFYPVKNAGPAQFLALIRDANAVCTDSFHGLALSVIYRRQFFVLDRRDLQANVNANFVRQENLLERAGIGRQRFVKCVRDVEEAGEIDYGKVQAGNCWEEVKALFGEVL